MKFTVVQAVGLAALGCAVSAAMENAAVYKFDGSISVDESVLTPVLSQRDSVLNLADELDVSDFYSLDELDNVDALALGKSNALTNTDKSKLFVLVAGVDKPNEFFEQTEPVFLIKEEDDRSNSQLRDLITELPGKLQALDGDLKLSKLSDEIALFGYKTKKALASTWSSYFHQKESSLVDSFWTGLVDSFGSSTGSQHPQQLTKRSLNLVNDEQFIKELTQLDFFLKTQLETSQEKVVINLKSLGEIFKKTGAGSQTYTACKRLVSELISQHLQKSEHYDATVVVLPLQQQALTLKFKEEANNAKRREAVSMVKRDEVNVFGSSTGCFSSQEACISSTSSCSGHGICSKVGKCWNCVCSSTVDKKSGRTSYWTGPFCQKKDMSAEFNLIFWTTLVLGAVFVAGVKLLVKVGSEELPGVLVAATVPTKKSI